MESKNLKTKHEQLAQALVSFGEEPLYLVFANDACLEEPSFRGRGVLNT